MHENRAFQLQQTEADCSDNVERQPVASENRHASETIPADGHCGGRCDLVAATPASAQSYPQRPIRIVVDRPAGVLHDTLARALSDRLSASLKQTVIVDNRVGAGGNLATEFVARSAPDGHTLLVALDTTLTVNPTLYKNLSFNPQTDLRPLSIMAKHQQHAGRASFPASQFGG